MQTQPKTALHQTLLEAWGSREPVLLPAQADQLIEYLQALLHWNRIHSLTAISDETEAVHRHLIDVMLTWPSLLRSLPPGESEVTLADVGSGTGVPGIPLAILIPRLRVSLIERVARKAAFLRHAVGRLGLSSRVSVLQQDIRDISVTSGYAIIASRAFAACEDFLDFSVSVSDLKTKWAYMAGKLSEINGLDEKNGLYRHPRAPDRYQVLSIEALEGPKQLGERHLIWMGRQA